MCVGPTMPISNFRRQAMTRQLSRAPAEGNTQSKHEWEDPGDSRQQGLLPKSNSPLSGYPTGRPSLGRWWLNVQPKHYTHTCTHIKIKTKNKNQPPTIQNLKTKPPMSTLKVKALSPGKQYHSGQQAQWGRTLLDERKLLPSHSSPLVLSSQKKVWNTSSTPKKKESDSATIFKRFSKAKKKKKKQLVAAGPESDWLYSLQPKMHKLHTVSKNKTRSWLWLRSWFFIAKFRLKLKKVGKTTRPFRYDLMQIPNNIKWKWEIDLRD